MIHLYIIDTVHKDRGQLFPLLKPFFKNEAFTDVQRQALYGISEKEYTLVPSPDQADYAVLAMSWNYYVHKKQDKAIQALVEATTLTVLSFVTGDQGVSIPPLQNCVVFRANGERSKLPDFHQGFPVIIPDPLKKHFQTQAIQLRDYQEKPIVGFCGQANGSIGNAIKEVSRTLFRNLRYALKSRKELPQPLFSTTLLRANVLRDVAKNEGIQTNFILRKKYRAGAHTPEKRKKTTQEFYDNIQESDYVVCVRGGGNFSVRFYEALAMGRIPVFINTDCLLPLADKIDWKQHVVWVEHTEKQKVAQKVMAFHQQHTPASFKKLQQANRNLWQERLTLSGFFKTTLKK